jgi:hypothetical protein
VLVSNASGSERGAWPGAVPLNRQHDAAQRMKALKIFLETRGAGLANSGEMCFLLFRCISRDFQVLSMWTSFHSSGEFLAYYALPFVPSPERHPSFEHLFQPE